MTSVDRFSSPALRERDLAVTVAGTPFFLRELTERFQDDKTHDEDVA